MVDILSWFMIDIMCSVESMIFVKVTRSKIENETTKKKTSSSSANKNNFYLFTIATWNYFSIFIKTIALQLYESQMNRQIRMIDSASFSRICSKKNIDNCLTLWLKCLPIQSLFIISLAGTWRCLKKTETFIILKYYQISRYK